MSIASNFKRAGVKAWMRCSNLHTVKRTTCPKCFLLLEIYPDRDILLLSDLHLCGSNLEAVAKRLLQEK